jgi:hypothetical protein
MVQYQRMSDPPGQISEQDVDDKNTTMMEGIGGAVFIIAGLALWARTARQTQ